MRAQRLISILMYFELKLSDCDRIFSYLKKNNGYCCYHKLATFSSQTVRNMNVDTRGLNQYLVCFKILDI